MPNPKLKKLYAVYQESDPGLLDGMDEASFVSKFSNIDKLKALHKITVERNAAKESKYDGLGGMEEEDFINKFKSDEDPVPEISQPRVGVSSPTALKSAGIVSEPKKDEKIDTNKPIGMAQESVGRPISPDIAMGGNPFELTDLKDQDPLVVGKANIKNYDTRYSEGVKANKERTEYELGQEALSNAQFKAANNVDKVKLNINALRSNDDAFEEFLTDLQAASTASEKDPEQKDPNTIKILQHFQSAWGDVYKSEMVQKYLLPSYDFLNKFQESDALLKQLTPNHQKYLQENQKKQAEADKRNYLSYGGSAAGTGSKLKRVIGGTWLGNIAAIGKQFTDSQVFYDLGEYAKQIEESHPAATRHQRNTVEDYIHDDQLGLDLVFDYSDNSKNPEFSYFVDPKTGNKANLIITHEIEKKIDQYAKNKKFENRRVPGAIVSQGFDELIEEGPEVAVALFTDGLLSAGMKGLRAIKATGPAGKVLGKVKAMANTKLAKDITAKHVGAHIGELLAGTIEGSADFREEALKAGLSEEEAGAFQLAAGLNAGIADAINPMEVMAVKGNRSLFFKNKIADYASGKITKADLFKQTGLASVVNLSKNLGADTASEGVLEPAIGNKIRRVFNDLKGSDFKETDINPRNIEAGFWLSAISSGAFSVPTSIRVSKGGLMADAIKYAVKNPEVMDAYFKGRRADQGGQALDRENYLRSVLDQVKEAGLNENNQAKAAALIIDRQNASLEQQKLIDKYGADAPLVKRKNNELIDIEKKLDNLFALHLPDKEEPATAETANEADKGKASAEPPGNDPGAPPSAAPQEINPAEEKAAESSSEAVTPPESKQKKVFSDFDNTLFNPKTGQLTDLGKQMKDRIAKGEDVDILTAREDTPENRKIIADQLGIDPAKIKMGLTPEGKAAALSAHKGEKVFYDDNKDNLAAAQGTGAEVVDVGKGVSKPQEEKNSKKPIYRMPAILPKNMVVDGENTLMDEDELALLDAKVEKILAAPQRKDVTDTQRVVAGKNAFLANEIEDINTFMNERRAGRETRSFSEWRKNTRETKNEDKSVQNIAEQAPKQKSIYDLEKEYNEGEKIQWDAFGNEKESEWTIGKQTKTRKGEDAVELSKQVVEPGTNNPPHIETHVVPLKELADYKKEATSPKQKSIDALEKEYNNQDVDALVALKKKLYPNPDIESPMSPEEKLLDKVIAKKFSDKNQEIANKRKEAAQAKKEIEKNPIPPEPTEEEKSDTHKRDIHNQFRKEFASKGIPDKQIDAAIALMETRARVWAKEKEGRKPNQWYARIAGVKSGTFEKAAKPTEEEAKKIEPKQEPKSPTTIALEKELEDDQNEIKKAKEKLAKKRQKLTKSALDDAKDLFGDRKESAANKLFDERVDGDIEELTEQERNDVKAAEKKAEKTKKALEESKKRKDPTIFDQPEKATEPKSQEKKSDTKNIDYEKRYSETEQRELNEGNRILRQIIINQGEISGTSSEDERFEKLAEKAKEQGHLINNIDEILGEEDTNGTESLVWGKKGDKTVTKAMSYDMEGSVSNLIDKIIVHNNTFPETKITVKGIGYLSDGTAVFIIEQPLVIFSDNPTLSTDEIIDFMAKHGFEPITKEEFPVFSNGRYKIADLHEGNIGYSKDGSIAVIDFFADIDRGTDTKSKIDKDIDDIWEYFGKMGISNTPEQQAKDLEMGIKLASLYLKKGVYKLADIVESGIEKLGFEKISELLQYIKNGYLAYQAQATDEELDQMDDTKTVRNYTIKPKSNEPDKGQPKPNPIVKGSAKPNRGNLDRTPEGKQPDLFSGIEDEGDSIQDGLGETGGIRRKPKGVSKEESTARGSERDRERAALQVEKDNYVPLEEEPGDIITVGEKQDNFVIDENSLPKTFNVKSRFNDNINALKTLATLKKEKRHATKEEQEVLSRYVGWGGIKVVLNNLGNKWNDTDEAMRPQVEQLHELIKELEGLGIKDILKSIKASVLNAHYTNIGTIKAIYSAIQQFGFNNGHILDPSAGIGHFTGAMPLDIREGSKITQVEKDQLTGEILKQLYPQSSTHIKGLEESKLPNNYYDLIISNIPFGDFGVFDAAFNSPELKQFTGKIHNYFFAKAIQQAKEGGLIAFVTSAGVMDSSSNKPIRQYINNNTEFVGAIRLPSSAFEGNANTSVVTDIIFLRKTSTPNNETAFLDNVGLSVPHKSTGEEKRIAVNEYFVNNPGNVIGELKAGGLYRDNEMTVIAPKATDINKEIERIIKETFPTNIYSKQRSLPEPELEKSTAFHNAKPREIYIDEDGKAYLKIDDYSEKEAIAKSHSVKKVKDFIKLRETLNKQYQLESEGLASEAEIEQNRKDLNSTYNDFVVRHGKLNKKENKALINKDVNGYNVLSLEKDTGKADIFTKKVINAKKIIASAENIDDAISISINEYGRINMGRISSLLNQDEETIIKNNYGLIFYDSNGSIVSREEYLSGNVKRKLSEALLLAQGNPIYEKNAEALRQVIPEDIEATDIEVNIGARWIPTNVYEQFVNEIFNTSSSVYYSSTTDTFDVKANKTVESENKYGTAKKSGIELLEDAMHNKTPVVWKTSPFDETKKVIDLEKTAEARDKQELIKEEFKDWIFADFNRRTELARRYNDLFNTSVKRKHDGSRLTFEGLNNIDLRPHQKDAIAMLINNMGGIIDHIVGSGKAQPLDAKLLTPSGWTTMGDIAVGDMVVSVDGKPTKVTGVFPQGEKDIYKVKFSDGSSTECCKEHLWLTHTYEERSYATMEKRLGKNWNCSKPKVRTLDEISKTLISNHLGAKNHSIPIVSAIHFEPQSVKVDPYLIGALIGDGGLTRQVTFSTADAEMIDLLSERLPANIKIKKKPSAKYDYSLVMEKMVKIGKRIQPNPLQFSLSEYGLDCKSEFKRIPSQYLFNTIEIRVEVLRGLMDTDGYVGNKGTSINFCTSSSGLAEDVAFLIRSLGGICSMRTKIPTYSHNGEKRIGLRCYNLSIKMPPEINPFRLKRKAELVVAKTKYTPVRYIVGVEHVGKKQAQCISVENESRLYVTDDFIVTHNTLIQIAGAIKMKQIGLINKPAIIGLKSTIPDLVAEAKSAYPGARILAPTETDFSAKNRKKFLSKIQNNDWDLIIMSHDQFGSIPQDPEIQIETINDELAMLEQEILNIRADGKEASKAALKGLEKRKQNLLKKLAELLDAPKDIEILNFKQIGIDHIMVDESQMFKNLAYTTKINRVAGLGDPTGSKRSFNMLNAARTLQKMNNGDKGVTFLSGTPISNSLVEMYLLFKYLRPNSMDELGYKTFDAWVSQFAEAKSEAEFSVSSEIKQKLRFRRFINIEELSKLYQEIADVRNDNNLTIPKPKIKAYINEKGESVNAPQLVAVKQSDYQKEWTKRLIAFANQKHGQRDGSLIGRPNLTENQQTAAMLMITNLSTKLSVDMRLIDPNAEDNPTGKLSAVANNVAKIFHETSDKKSTQLIFSDIGTPKSKNAVDNLKNYLQDELLKEQDDLDAIFGEEGKKAPTLKVAREKMIKVFELTDEEADEIIEQSKETEEQFNVYSELKRKLIENGVPADQVVFIHSYNTKKAKEELFKKVNSGEIRIVLGSTQKLGTGVNAQKKIIALHHVDASWNPAAMEQRNGRGIRQKNENEEVAIYNYGTELTLDAYKYQLIASKQRFINQIKSGSLNGQRTVDEGDGEDMTMQEYVAILSGNPLIMALAKIDNVVAGLRRSKKSFISERQKNEYLYNSTKNHIPILEAEVNRREKDVSKIKAVGKDEDGKQKIVVKVEGKKPFENAKELGQYIIDKKAEALKKPLGTTIQIGTVNGMELSVTTVRTESHNSFGLFSEIEPRVNLQGEERYSVTSSADPTAQGTAITNAINKVEPLLDVKREELAKSKKNVSKYADLLTGEWPKQKELDEALAEQKRINAELNPPESQEGQETQENEEGQPKFQIGPDGNPKGAIETLEDGRVIISAFESADFSTMVHEIAHIFEYDLTEKEQEIISNFGGSEQFAIGFEKYLSTGKAPTPELKSLFEKFKEWLLDIYRVLIGSPIENDIPSDIKEIFDRLLTEKLDDTIEIDRSFLKQIKDYATRIIKGEKVYERLSPEEEKGRIAGGRTHVEVSVILGRIQRTVPTPKNHKERLALKQKQEEAIQDYAEQTGQWVDNIEEKYGNQIEGGQEHNVYQDKSDPTVLIKTTETSPDSWLGYTDSLALHNNYFPGTAYTIIGFGRNKSGDLVTILKQKTITGTRPDFSEVIADLSAMGFEMIPETKDLEDKDKAFRNKSGVVITDVAEGNVIKTKDGIFLYIDPQIAPDTIEAGYGGNRKVPGNNALISNPIDPTLSQEDKADELRKLSEENQNAVIEFLKGVDEEIGTQSKTSFKTKQSILEKANRPSIKANQPQHDVEHVRDSFRFKTVLDSLDQLRPILRRVASSNMQVVKLDVSKIFSPGPWGWRIAAIDLMMPNGQIVEYYFPIKEVEQAKKDGNHKVFEKWRNRNISELSVKELEEYKNDIELSNKKYQRAWDGFVARSGLSETALRADFSQLLNSLPEEMASKLVYESSASGAPQAQSSPSNNKETNDLPEPQETQTLPVDLSTETKDTDAIPKTKVQKVARTPKKKDAVFKPSFNWFGPMGIELKKEPKARKIPKRYKKAQRKIKDPRYIAALHLDPGSPRDLALRFFIRGNKMAPAAIRDMFKNAGEEITARFSLLNKELGFKTIDAAAHQIWSDQEAEMGAPDVFSAEEISNALEGVLIDNLGTKKMVDELLSIYNAEPGSDAEYEAMKAEAENRGFDIEGTEEEVEVYEDTGTDEDEDGDPNNDQGGLTDEEKESGDYDEDGNFTRFQLPINVVFEEASSAESVHKTKCR